MIRRMILCASILSTSSVVFASPIDFSVSGSVVTSQQTLQYRLYEPQAVSAEKLPLVLFLHGAGERGTDNVAQTTHISGLIDATRSGQFASYVLAPQIGKDDWFQSWSNTPTDAMAATIELVKQVIANKNVDTSRIYVTGLSMGGMGTWDIISREPGLFAAAAPMSGGGDVRTAAKVKDIPIWAFHGDRDTIVPVSATYEMIQAVQDAGGSPRYTEVAGGGHVIWEDIYGDPTSALYQWMFAQQRLDEIPQPISVEFAVPEAAAIVSAAVPEPGTLSLVLMGAGVALMRRKRRTA